MDSMKILYLIDSLDFSGSARQLQLLGPALADTQTAVTVCCLGPDTPWSASLRSAGVTVHALGWNRWFDFGALWNLRAILQHTAFDVIHVWRLNALRALAVATNGHLSRVVMSAPLPASGNLVWWDRHLLNRVRCVAVAGASDQDRCVHHGIAAPLHVVAPAVENRRRGSLLREGEAPAEPVFPQLAAWQEPRPPDTRYRIACVGSVERDAGFRQAIWAFDFVLHAFPDAQLQLVGNGSQLPALRMLVHGLQCGEHVQFLGELADATDALRAADIVWIPSQANTGRQVALEAMALGRVVVASDVPSLREVIQDGVTGYLVPARDVLQFMRRTSWLLLDAPLREQIGAAARQHVEQSFPLNAALASWLDVYRGVAAGA
jgi:glycosyltransferase involved in cell wall biosynthesis